MQSDLDAIAAVRNGDKERYADLVERHKKMVYGIAWSHLGDADLCEDAAQETFVKAFRYLGALRSPEKFPAWLARIARNVSTSFLRTRCRELERRKRWKIEQASTMHAETPHAEDESLGETLRQILAELPERDRSCLVLFYLEGKNIREAATALDISESAMKTRLHRARHTLRGQLEERLESSLTELGPRRGFSQGVMALLPAAPATAAWLGGSSIATKFLWGPAFFIQFLILPLVQGLFTTALFGWLGKLEGDNLAASPTKKFRQKIIRGNVIAIVFVTVFLFMLNGALITHFSPRFMFQILTVYCAWGMYASARTLRVNRSPFVVGQFVSIVFFFAISVLIGFGHAPYWIFFLGMLPLNIYLYQTNKTRPLRHDYNLFFRQAKGLLGAPPEEVPARSNYTETELRAFTQFLGERFLVRDYKRRARGLVLWLPPVKPGVEQFLGATGSTSSININLEGRCEAHFSKSDRRLLLKHADIPNLDAEAMEADVGKIVETALYHFVEGRADDAARLLQAEADESVFVQPVAKTREHRIRGGLAIGAAVFLLVFMLFIDPYGIGFDAFPRAVSREDAQVALVQWLSVEKMDPWNYELTVLVFGEKVPPLSFVPVEAREEFKRIFTRRLLESLPGDMSDQIRNAVIQPDCLYHIIEANILTMDELAAIGITPESMRAVLESWGRDKLDELNSGVDTSFIRGNEKYDSWDIGMTSRRLVILKTFDCLDLVDADTLADRIAAAQITASLPAQPGHRPLERQMASGLFDFGYCDLRGTRGALWTLETLGELDRIDKEACIKALLRLHHGKGVFQASTDSGIGAYGHDEDMFFAMESLHILGGLDRVKDFDRWACHPETGARTHNGKTRFGMVTVDTIKSWTYQLRLEELRGE